MKSALEMEWNNIFAQLNEAEQKNLLHKLRGLIERKRIAAPAIDIEEYNREIDLSLAEIEAGNYITQKDMEKRASKW